MPSPFPGMNPYLERQVEWDSFHTLFIAEAMKQLAPKVGKKYAVRSGLRLYIHEPSAKERRYFAQADFALTPERTRPGVATKVKAAVLSTPRYRTIPRSAATEKLRFVEIRDADNEELVTVIELLSRTNKLPRYDREFFVSKRVELLRGDCHYVEINLIRAGRPLPFRPPVVGPYYAAVCRADDRERVGTWEWGLRDPLPSIPIPLRSPDGDVELNLKRIVEGIYDYGQFAPRIYTRRPDPPLPPEDEAWAKALIASGS